MRPFGRSRLRFSLRAVLVAFASVAAVLAFYVSLMKRPTLSVRQMPESEAAAAWLFGASPIATNPQAEPQRRYTAVYRPRHRKATEEVRGRPQGLVQAGDVAIDGSCGVGAGTELRIRASERSAVEDVLELAAQRDAEPLPGTVSITGVLLDSLSAPVAGASVGVESDGDTTLVGTRDDGSFHLVLPTDSPVLRAGWRFRVTNAPATATWLQGGGSWFVGASPVAVQPRTACSVVIQLPVP